MIDIEAASAAMSQINVGDMVTIEADGVTRELRVKAKSLYNVTVQGPTNTISYPVEFTAIYRKELEMRIGADAVAATRGRPRKNAPTGPQAPRVEEADVATAEAKWTPPRADTQTVTASPPATPGAGPSWAAPAAPAAEPVITPELALGWFRTKVVEMQAQNLADLAKLAETLIEDMPEPAPPAPTGPLLNPAMPPQRMSCLECAHMDLPNDQCGKYKLKVPVKVNVNAQEMCADFTDDFIPF